MGTVTAPREPVSVEEPGDRAAERAAERGDGRPRRRRVSVRARVLSSVLVMSALGLAASGAVADVIQNRRTAERVDAALAQEVQEFRTLAAEGVDPATGERFSSVQQLLLIALERNVPSENEMFLTYREGRPDQYSAGGLPELASSPDVLAAVAAVDDAAPNVVTTDVEVPDVGRVRLSIVPVSVDGSTASGKYVIAFAVDREMRPQADLMRTYALVALGALLLIGVVGWVVAGRLLRPLRRLRETTQRISETDLSQRVEVAGADDISELGDTFNAMLDRLETAFAAQREFLDDAGHELKTPLTIVRGHLELMDPDDPVDVAETRALLLDELDRMGRLVQDLILLAKAERADFVELGPVDLGPFTDEVLDKARALGPRDWRVDHRAEGVVHADGQRLTQALLQLGHNAVKFSEPGSTIAIGSRLDDDEVRLWVRDEGPGVRPEDVERIFGRFVRGGSEQPSGPGHGTGTGTDPGGEGSGLGLAIVRAIAEAHHGRVEVAPAHPTGAVFTIVLPQRQRPAPAGAGGASETPASPGGVERRPTPDHVAQEVAP